MIVHIGYHKTGTTFLQQHVFPNMEGMQYYDYHTCVKLFKGIYIGTSLEFNEDEFAAMDKSVNALYSQERLVGDMGTGLYNYEIANRLKRIGVNKIIITIRRQAEMVESIYRQRINQGGVLRPEKFIKDSDYFRWSYLDYTPLIQHYVELFGIENVLIIPQEEMRADMDLVLNKLASFCHAGKINYTDDKRSNVSLSYWSIKLLRIINHFTYNYYRRNNLISNKISTLRFRGILQKTLDKYIFLKFFKRRKFYSDSFKKEVFERYKSKNKSLDDTYNLNLSAYDYY